MNTQTIYDILDSLAAAEKVFSNEQDFQFEFAKALDALNEVVEVKLEALSLSVNWNTVQQLANNKGKINRDKKEYTDIIVKLDNGEYIAIELKMKTPGKICYYHTKGSGNVLTMVQNAYDENAYEFINDIKRLENIKYRYFFNNFTVSKGYAILLSNNPNYRFNNFHRSKIWKNYSICNGKILHKNGLKFGDNLVEYKTKNKIYKEIKLRNSYQLNWRNYQLTGYSDYQDKSKSSHPGFSYLVVEVL